MLNGVTLDSSLHFQSLSMGATLDSSVVHGWISMCDVAKELGTCGTDDVCEWWLVSTSEDLFI